MGLALLWSVGIFQVFHKLMPVLCYLMATWMTSILFQPALPLPAWRMVLSTLASAVVVSVIFYLFSRFGWP